MQSSCHYPLKGEVHVDEFYVGEKKTAENEVGVKERSGW